MPKPIIESYNSAPSALNFMSRAFKPSPGLSEDGYFPRIVMRWTGLRIEPSQLQAFRQATGVPEQDGVPAVYPHVFGFRLQMGLLTHRAYPLSIWT